MKLMSL